MTITIAVAISPALAGVYVLKRATLDDGWGARHSLESFSWVEAHLFLPLVMKQDEP